MASKLPRNGYILGLDVGGKRIGTALASVIARLPQPGVTLDATDDPIGKIKAMVNHEDIQLIVVGLPRNLEGLETAQSQQIRQFTDELRKAISVPVEFADESLSSVRADTLSHDTSFQNVSRDSLAACFILEEFFENTTIETE